MAESGSTDERLSFPADLPPEIELPLLGDLVLCAPVVLREAAEQARGREITGRTVIHGVLHLLGMDHQMISRPRSWSAEREILATLGIDDPYDADGETRAVGSCRAGWTPAAGSGKTSIPLPRLRTRAACRVETASWAILKPRVRTCGVGSSALLRSFPASPPPQ